VDGLVHITSLERDYFRFDPVHHRLSGERTGLTYRLGDSIRVRVAAVNLDERKIDFILAEEGQPRRWRTRGPGVRRQAEPAPDAPAGTERRRRGPGARIKGARPSGQDEAQPGKRRGHPARKKAARRR
jgi:ribonuclease R